MTTLMAQKEKRGILTSLKVCKGNGKVISRGQNQFIDNKIINHALVQLKVRGHENTQRIMARIPWPLTRLSEGLSL